MTRRDPSDRVRYQAILDRARDLAEASNRVRVMPEHYSFVSCLSLVCLYAEQGMWSACARELDGVRGLAPCSLLRDVDALALLIHGRALQGPLRAGRAGRAPDEVREAFAFEQRL